MSRENVNPSHDIFIREMITHGNKKRAYKAAYPGTTDESARTASTRLMKEQYIREGLKNAHLNIAVGIREDKEAFIHQELKILNLKRDILLREMNNKAQPLKEKIRAMQMDGELAKEQARLLGYGDLEATYSEQGTGNSVAQESVEAVTEKNAETVTKRNIREDNVVLDFPLQPATGKGLPPFLSHGNEIYPVTNRNTVLCKTG